MEIRVNTSLTDTEQTELNAWINTRGSEDIEYVTVDAGAVAIYGRAGGQSVSSAIAIRYPGRLMGALDEALATLRNTP